MSKWPGPISGQTPDSLLSGMLWSLSWRRRDACVNNLEPSDLLLFLLWMLEELDMNCGRPVCNQAPSIQLLWTTIVRQYQSTLTITHN